MKSLVSVVIPALDDRELLARHLPPLIAELDARAIGDEIVVVDDTGTGVLEPWVAEHFPPPLTFDSARVEVRAVVRAQNGGFARAALAGVEAASHEHVFLMNPDVRVRAGFLAPLQAVLADERVFAAVPRVLLNGAESHCESAFHLAWTAGEISVVEDGLDLAAPHSATNEESASRTRPVVTALGGAVLLRRSEFTRLGGFDPLYLPFYWEDVDLGFTAWRSGRSIACAHASIVEHHHRGTIGRRLAPEIVRAAIERNRLLFTWKHLDDARLVREHLDALEARVVDACLAGREEDLVPLALALDDAHHALRARARLPRAERSFTDVLRATSTVPGTFLHG